MSRIRTYPILEWDIPGDMGQLKGRQKLFIELSPPEPIIQLQIWIRWYGILGGDASSKLEVTSSTFTNALAVNNINASVISLVNATGGTTYETYELENNAAPPNGGNLFRVGNFGNDDGRKMSIYGDNYFLVVQNSGTAYTAGKVIIAPMGWTA